mmetsp:Transcript_54318/g.99853  ORF Transcript_54318/g.99853 Transcript_54318/m.99853 type:complete len:367 (-) Transcript_54318:238-1338(-)
MGLGSDVVCWMQETGFQGSFMDAWEAYGNGDDVHVSFRSEFGFEIESESETHSESEIEFKSDGFTQHSGFLTRGGDLLVATMTVPEALRRAMELQHCKGLCFRGPVGDHPVEVFFKSKWDVRYASEQVWTFFRKVHPFWPTNIIIVRNLNLLMAGQVYAVAGESPVWQHSMHWDLEKPSDRWDSLHDLRVAKSEHGDVWVEHDDLPFQVRMLKTKYGLYAGDIHWVKGETRDGDLLLENARRLPQFATNLWEEVKVVDMQNNIKLSLLAAIKASGSTKAWRANGDWWRGAATSSFRPVAITTAMARSVSGSQVRCSQCGITKAANAFSGNQRKRAVARRRCKTGCDQIFISMHLTSILFFWATTCF